MASALRYLMHSEIPSETNFVVENISWSRVSWNGNIENRKLAESSGLAASNRYDFIFSNVRGNIHESPSRNFIFRQNIVPGDPLSLIDIMIDGHLDWRYRKVRNNAICKFSL